MQKLLGKHDLCIHSLTLAPVIASKDLMHNSGCLGVGVQLGRVTMETALLHAINEVA